MTGDSLIRRDVITFARAVYGEHGWAEALVNFSEDRILRDATEVMTNQDAEIEVLREQLEQYQIDDEENSVG